MPPPESQVRRRTVRCALSGSGTVEGENGSAVSVSWWTFTGAAVVGQCGGLWGARESTSVGSALRRLQWSSHLELAGFCSPACPTGSWTCSSFASVPAAVEFSPGRPCLRFCLLPARVARKPAKACLPLAQDKARASFLGPGTTKHHKDTGTEPKALVTFFSALTAPAPPATGLPAHSVAACHTEVSR